MFSPASVLKYVRNSLVQAVYPQGTYVTLSLYLSYSYTRKFPFFLSLSQTLWPQGFRAHSTCTNSEPSSKLRSAVAHMVEKAVPWHCDLQKRSTETLPSGEPFVPNQDLNSKYKTVYFCTKLFKNTIFTMYEWWRFQRYRTCLKKLGIRIGIE